MIAADSIVAKLLETLRTEVPRHEAPGSLSIKELCRWAGVGRSTFYTHFESLDDFLSRGLVLILEEYHSKTRLPPRTTEDAEENIRFLVEMVRNNRHFFRALLNAEGYQKQSRIFKERMRFQIERELADRFPGPSTPETELLIGLMTSGVLELVDHLTRVDDPELETLLVRTFYRFTIFGTSFWFPRRSEQPSHLF